MRRFSGGANRALCLLDLRVQAVGPYPRRPRLQREAALMLAAGILLLGLIGAAYGIYALVRGGRDQEGGGLGPIPERTIHAVAGIRMLIGGGHLPGRRGDTGGPLRLSLMGKNGPKYAWYSRGRDHQVPGSLPYLQNGCLLPRSLREPLEIGAHPKEFPWLVNLHWKSRIVARQLSTL